MDISLAALLGKNIYNFGELLLHPIVSNPLACLNYLQFIVGSLALLQSMTPASGLPPDLT